jgi:hypothetical protein
MRLELDFPDGPGVSVFLVSAILLLTGSAIYLAVFGVLFR